MTFDPPRRRLTAIKLSFPDVPRLVRGIQESRSVPRSLDPADKPRDVGLGLNLMAVGHRPTAIKLRKVLDKDLNIRHPTGPFVLRRRVFLRRLEAQAQASVSMLRDSAKRRAHPEALEGLSTNGLDGVQASITRVNLRCLLN